ncbi:hypothetical protein RhiirA5_421178 [Rhizophagus irregularis]|uniref:RNase H type-1 domain-containing protein n=1 Tax=Rhizophagus irregularis TaxID=588596 RepID=A0A2I1ESR2_9GLOM|nr:hypothetical protein RhiirA5_421178 [Rhizophagus irregularis]PKC60379.1 hypothetical protein RhiirA1_468126 [Rhizophagus irregularis]PKY25176.1 hypothetical protein RhiirB3_440000 [Rhizophagus irregularis]GET53504.1 hypothetical protein GLOIN_2v1767041 [Rhizophagus irregularis DAOM 181602=DAOM 197198]
MEEKLVNSGIGKYSRISRFDENHNLIDELYATIENWITSIKAETFAFLLELFIGHDIEKVYIYTDSELVYNRFNDLVKKNDFVNARKIFKEQNNLYYWALIKNSKYIQVEVDWSLTFEYLKEGEKVLTTSFWTTRRRRKKIQRLIEEMPTIEQSNEIINLEKYNCDVKKLENLFNNEKFGKLLVDESNLTFTDLIKGIFPLKLSEFISSEFKMNIEDKVKVAIRRNQNNLERKMRKKIEVYQRKCLDWEQRASE